MAEKGDKEKVLVVVVEEDKWNVSLVNKKDTMLQTTQTKMCARHFMLLSPVEANHRREMPKASSCSPTGARCGP